MVRRQWAVLAILVASAGAITPAWGETQEGSQRAAEIQVELAWLADPVTYPCFLEARVHGTVMEVRGHVPSRAAREQALRLARLHCPYPVVDRTREFSHIPPLPTGVPARQLHKAITAHLRQTYADRLQGLEVQCTAEGKVTVTGQAPTLEEKLAVSKAMRRLHGCTCVHNQLRVPSGPPAQHSSSGKTPSPLPLEVQRSALALPKEKPGEGLLPLINMAAKDLEAAFPVTVTTAEPELARPFAEAKPPDETPLAHVPETPVLQAEYRVPAYVPTHELQLAEATLSMPLAFPPKAAWEGKPAQAPATKAHDDKGSSFPLTNPLAKKLPSRQPSEEKPNGYVTQGLVVFEEEKAAEPLPGGAKTGLADSIRAACPFVRHVRVHSAAAGRVRVDLQVDYPDQVRQCTERILSLPEVAALEDRIDLFFIVTKQ